MMEVSYGIWHQMECVLRAVVLIQRDKSERCPFPASHNIENSEAVGLYTLQYYMVSYNRPLSSSVNLFPYYRLVVDAGRMCSTIDRGLEQVPGDRHAWC